MNSGLSFLFRRFNDMQMTSLKLGFFTQKPFLTSSVIRVSLSELTFIGKGPQLSVGDALRGAGEPYNKRCCGFQFAVLWILRVCARFFSGSSNSRNIIATQDLHHRWARDVSLLRAISRHDSDVTQSLARFSADGGDVASIQQRSCKTIFLFLSTKKERNSARSSLPRNTRLSGGETRQVSSTTK